MIGKSVLIRSMTGENVLIGKNKFKFDDEIITIPNNLILGMMHENFACALKGSAKSHEITMMSSERKMYNRSRNRF